MNRRSGMRDVMDIFSVIGLLGGLAFFLFGMNTMSQGLEKLAGGRLEGILSKMTSNRFKGLLLGVGVTAVIQSSSAVTVMLVGLVNSGIMKIGQTVGVIMGANIGTTVTAWLLSLIGIEGGGTLMKFLKPENFSLVLGFLGIVLIMLSKRQKKKDVGGILLGFAVLMYGMKLMSDAVSPLRDMPQFTSLLTAFENPFFGILAGALLTGIIQSSSASVGILQALTLTGSVSYAVAIPIIMGQNIGTCVTALISSIGVNRNAKKVSVIHVSFNLFGTAICLILYYAVGILASFGIGEGVGALLKSAIDPVGVATVHSVFNIGTTVLLLPFTRQLEKLANRLIRDDVKETSELLDTRLLVTPSLAVAECRMRTEQMAEVACSAITEALSLFQGYDEATAASILEKEDRLDHYEDKLGTYLVAIGSHEVSAADSGQKNLMLHVIGDFERLGDHAVNLVKVATEMRDKKVHFSREAQAELRVLTEALTEILSLTLAAFQNNDTAVAQKVEPLEQVIDQLIGKIKNRHFVRLQEGSCTIQLGFVLSDMLTNYERVSDHCSNIAVALIEVAKGGFDTHEYLNKVKSFSNLRFNENYEEYSQKYRLRSSDTGVQG